MALRPDPESPVPLYHQIAAGIRDRIAAGELQPGQTLEPLREAARRMGVNVHTVRHAYAELARDGWVESRRSRGTRVLPRPGEADRGEATANGRRFEAVVDGACRELGLSRSELHARLGAWLGSRHGVVWVVECSESQSADLARQLEAAWGIEARPWPLDREGAPEGSIVATYFHYNEIRRRWPDRLAEVSFLTIRPDPGLPGRLLAEASSAGRSEAERARVVLLERDAPTLEALLADLSVLLAEDRFELHGELVEGSWPGVKASEIQLLSPRLWGERSAEERSDPSTFQLRYVFDSEELEQLGQRAGWRRRPAGSLVS